MTWKNFPYPPPGRRLILVKEFSHFLISFFRSRMGRTSGASSEVKSLNNNFVLLRYTLGWQLCYVFEPGEWGFESRWKSDQQKQQRSSSVGKQILIILLLWFIVTCVKQTFLLSQWNTCCTVYSFHHTTLPQPNFLHQPCSQGLSLLPLVGFVSQSKGNLLHVQSWSLDMNWVDAGRRIFPALSDVSASSTLAWVLIDKLMKKASINTSIKSPVDRPFQDNT